MTDKIVRIGIIGSYYATDGYPNIKWLLDSIYKDKRFLVYAKYPEIRGVDKGLSQKRNKNIFVKFSMVLRLISKSILSFCDCMLAYYTKKIDLVYSPYPAHFSLLLLSFVPSSFRPITVADGFISLYDTIVNDRELVPKSSIRSKVLYLLERRCYMSATLMITDTACSANYMSQLYDINISRFWSVPLMTDEINFIEKEYSEDLINSELKVTFIGTFVPLQGVDVIGDAIRLLEKRQDIFFIIVGYGQTASLFSEKISGLQNVNWLKNWASPDEMYNVIKDADLCLGVFGTSEKASRVWPFKNYNSMRVGRAIISQKTDCIPGTYKTCGTLYYPVAAGSPEDLAKAIVELAENSKKRKEIADTARLYYRNHLSNHKALEAYYHMFNQLLSRLN